MPYEITPHIGIISATLTLSAAQLRQLAVAHVHLQAVCEAYPLDSEGTRSIPEPPEKAADEEGRPAAVVALDPVCELLNQIAALVSNSQLVQVQPVEPPAAPKRRGGRPRKVTPDGQNPTTGQV